MAEAIGVAGSIIGIVAFGLQLGVTLQTHIEAAVEASDRLQEIAFEINSTAGVLSQLHDVIKKDSDAAVPIFNTDGVRDIKRLSDRCKRIYGVIIILLNEAVECFEDKKAKKELSADSLDVLSLKLNKLGFRRKLAWPWLEPRIKRCQQELRQVKLNLFLHIQVVNLALFQIHHPTRAPGSLEEEQALKELAQELMKKRASHAKQLMQRHTEKADKTMAPTPIPKVGKVAAPPGVTVSMKEFETPTLLATTTQDAELGRQLEDGPDKPMVGPSPEPDGIQPTMESDRTQPQDKNMVENAVHPLAHCLQGQEASSIPSPPPFFFSLHPYAASDRVDEDDTNGDYTDSSDREDGGPRDDEEGSIRGSTSPHTDTTSSKRMLRFMPDWAHGIFSRGRNDDSHGDRESDGLEAFLLELPARTDPESASSLMKLDIGQSNLEAALSAIMPRRWRRGRPQLWDQYKALDPRVRHEIHLAITLAKQETNQSKTWIAMEVMQSPVVDRQDDIRVVLFFRIGEEVEPVNMKAVGHKFTLPYEHCRSWEMMETTLVQAFSDTGLDDKVRNGRYDIVNADTDAIIPSGTWRSAVLPGMDLKMNVWLPRQRVGQAPWQGYTPPLSLPGLFPGGRIGGMLGGRPLPGGIRPPGRMPSGMRPAPSPWMEDERESLRMEDKKEPPRMFRTVAPRKDRLRSRIALLDHEPGPLQQVSIDVPPLPGTDTESETGNNQPELDEEIGIEELLGIEEGVTDDIDTSKIDIGELLKRWTNAPDAGGNGMLSSDILATLDSI